MTARTTTATVLTIALAIAAAMLVPASALADGDPASDVLLGENVYYPYDPAVSASLQRKLNDETAAASRAHFPIKVALITTAADLGAIPTLFGKPQEYARFLEQEISFLSVKPLLLVVMPDGYGSQHLGLAATAVVTSLGKPVSAHSDDLARAAIAAVTKLAAAAGHRLEDTSGDASPAGPNPTLPAVILAVASITSAAVVLMVRRRRAPAEGGRALRARKSRPHRG
ncbi:MAG: hypothetical protein JO304_27325 [Solirubrobacterales bacterium]|nr:hypothetical protein [Solirubrobacterales bacterium]